jgi:hypothetical protein
MEKDATYNYIESGPSFGYGDLELYENNFC